MELELRAITDDEVPAYARAVGRAFGDHYSDQEVADWALVGAGSDRFAVWDEGEVVATGGAFSFELTLPGGAAVAASGLTAIGVRPTHRRRGLLTSMVRHHLDQVAERGQALSVLIASEAVIYGRYGYGPAADLSWWRLPRGTALIPAPRAGGRLRMVDRDEARQVLPVVWEAHRASTPGALTRTAAFWDHVFLDRERDREGASALFFVVHESDGGEPDGYATYRIKAAWDGHGLPASELLATAVIAADPEVEAALWALLLEVDLVTTVQGQARPVDDHLRWRLADPRRLQVQRVSDHLWVRILDVAACLEARGYEAADSLVLEVVDAFRPDLAGRWRLTAGPDGAVCTPTGEAADVVLGVAELGSLLLGGARASTLARAGRVEVRAPGVAGRLDRLLASPVVPWCAIEF